LGYEAAQEARDLYSQALSIASSSLSLVDPIRIDIAMTYSAFVGKVLKDRAEVARIATTESGSMAKGAFDDAISELDNVCEETYKDSTLIMQLLRDNLTLWTEDANELEPPERKNSLLFEKLISSFVLNLRACY
jgi:14-3-3 protein epsilon